MLEYLLLIIKYKSIKLYYYYYYSSYEYAVIGPPSLSICNTHYTCTELFNFQGCDCDSVYPIKWKYIPNVNNMKYNEHLFLHILPSIIILIIILIAYFLYRDRKKYYLYYVPKTVYIILLEVVFMLLYCSLLFNRPNKTICLCAYIFRILGFTVFSLIFSITALKYVLNTIQERVSLSMYIQILCNSLYCLFLIVYSIIYLIRNGITLTKTFYVNYEPYPINICYDATHSTIYFIFELYYWFFCFLIFAQVLCRHYFIYTSVYFSFLQIYHYMVLLVFKFRSEELPLVYQDNINSTSSLYIVIIIEVVLVVIIPAILLIQKNVLHKWDINTKMRNDQYLQQCLHDNIFYYTLYNRASPLIQRRLDSLKMIELYQKCTDVRATGLTDQRVYNTLTKKDIGISHPLLNEIKNGLGENV